MKSKLQGWAALTPTQSDLIEDLIIPINLEHYLLKDPQISKREREVDSFHTNESNAQSRADEIFGKSVFDALNIKGSPPSPTITALSSIMWIKHPNWDVTYWIGLWKTSKPESLIASYIVEPKDYYFWKDIRPADDCEVVNGSDDISDWFCSTLPKFDPKQGYPTVSTLLYRFSAGDEGEESWVEFSDKNPDGIAITDGAYFSLDDDAALDGPISAPQIRGLSLTESISKLLRLGSNLHNVTSQGYGWVQDLASIALVQTLTKEIKFHREQG